MNNSIHDQKVRSLAACFREAVAQGYQGDIAEWEPTKQDLASIEAEVGCSLDGIRGDINAAYAELYRLSRGSSDDILEFNTLVGQT